jgi:hypothetical protein
MRRYRDPGRAYALAVMSPLAKAIRAFHHMSYQECLLWILGVSAVLYFLFSPAAASNTPRNVGVAGDGATDNGAVPILREMSASRG